MPAPMMAPMPSVVRFSAPRVFLSVPSPVASASARRRAIDFVAHKLMRTSDAWEVSDGWRRRDALDYGWSCRVSSSNGVIRRFARDHDAVGMGFAQPRARD